ncbi:MAG TPA: hypothetical protein VHG51_04165 [Longimicrobiaceae bacterium]|nr:hypothetical protein [Longimicrobiaceae bacterium]
MTRTRGWTTIRGGLLALAFAGAMGFGATQALAAPEQARTASCSRLSGPTFDDGCDQQCRASGFDFGYCHSGVCVCRNFL